jgi:N-acyl-L-homoserine lactone synthetase
MPKIKDTAPSENNFDNRNIEQILFEKNPENKFAIKILGPEYISEYKKDSIEEMYLKLRAQVYIEENRFLDESLRRPDGTEIDKDDERATHIIALRNKIGGAAVVGCIRLPQKTTYDKRPLPVEEFFPEYFENPAPINSIEVSRLIVTEQDKIDRFKIKKALMAYAVAYTIKHELGPVYAIVEEQLIRDLTSMNVPLEVITEPKFIEKYNSVNYAIQIDQYEFDKRLGKEAIAKLSTTIGSTDFFGENKT